MSLKGDLLPKVSLFILCFSFINCSTNQKKYFEDEDWVSLAKKSEKYIQTAKSRSEEGVIWKQMPDSTYSKTNDALYRGSSGIVLFYLELFNTTSDSMYLNEAKLGADYLVNTIQDTIYNSKKVGLYSGLAGIGFALTEVFKTTREEKYKKAVLKTVDILDRSSKKSLTGIHWDSITDIVYGSAGIGLYLQHVADELSSKKADSLAILVGNGLLDHAVQEDKGIRWKAFPNDSYFFDNFSHGASGIGYFLIKSYERTQDKKYLAAAIGAGDFLDSISNEKGYVPHHLPNKEELYYLNWCNGPVGTSRFYYLLYETTKDQKWLDKITFSANHLMLEGIDYKETSGYWNNVGKCCGATGVAEYYLWLFEITGNIEYLEFSEKMTQRIVYQSTQEKGYMKWIHAENRKSPDVIAAQTGLMQGSAGIGLWFLQINSFQNQRAALIKLPDTPKP
ncbi:lanthionine synthetase LanC family protein [Aquimarina gracilis]|uniref:Lanthionine synthetase LanC family protein n=1 Tax=Aquimarina gracilis TaxID=874422 RepID=A0ABU5ZSC3_9FLAO|nr:lanthionine synthetase LanC family protein [Aquimarina gracilis]MEB3344975.1 lanthionine synthetase LanC family protein [Aquimarina gracilis]